MVRIFYKSLWIILVFYILANTVFSNSYKDKLILDSNFKSVSQEKISQARILQSYIIEYKKNVNMLYGEYKSGESQIMQDANTILNTMANSLESIQKRPVNPSVVEDIFQSISTDLRSLNQKMKIYLEQEKIISDQVISEKKRIYIQTGRKISSIIDLIILKVSSELKKKTNYSQKDKNIVAALVELQNINTKINLFSNQNYSSVKEMDDFFKNIIRSIRKQISIIKNP